MNENKYELKEKAWIISEVKASMIEVFNNFIKKRDMFVRSLKGIADPVSTRAEFISALYEYFNMSLNGFVSELHSKESKHTEVEFQQLAYEEVEFSNEKLLSMAYELNKWNFTKGFFRITHQELAFKDPVSQMEYENSMT